MYMARKLAYNKKGTLNLPCVSVVKKNLAPPNSLDELGGFSLYQYY